MGKYIIGLIAIAFAIALIIKTEWFIENFGTSSWAEEHMGTSGGTRLLYKLVGMAIIFFAMLSITGLMEGFLMGTIGKLFNFGK